MGVASGFVSSPEDKSGKDVPDLDGNPQQP